MGDRATTGIYRISRPASLAGDAMSDQTKWRTIETAPRNSTHIIVAYRRDDGEWRIMEAWWATPYEAAPLEKGWWQTMGGVLLSADVHRAGARGDGPPLGATHWMPLPDPPSDTP